MNCIYCDSNSFVINFSTSDQVCTECGTATFIFDTEIQTHSLDCNVKKKTKNHSWFNQFSNTFSDNIIHHAIYLSESYNVKKYKNELFAMCLYMSCKYFDAYRTTKEISTITNTRLIVIHSLLSKFDLVKNILPSDFTSIINRFSIIVFEIFNLNIRHNIINIVDLFDKYNMLNSKRKDSIVVTAICCVLQRKSIRKFKKVICEHFNISLVTINKLLLIIKPHLNFINSVIT